MTGEFGELRGIGEWFEGDAEAQGLGVVGSACFGGGDDHGVFDGDDGTHGSASGGDAFVLGG